ncbi:MAG: 6-bladed beta-propeller [Mediterranea sp.]|jgi:hypothetical protein|nr:6-bladed beta-propeller [Mediterranea sp.]
MKRKLYLLILLFLVIACTPNKKDNGIITVDIVKNYPQKIISLDDIADISYLSPSSDSIDFLFRGRVLCVTSNNIITCDNRTGTVLFFSMNGTPKHRFNHQGSGPQEYGHIKLAVYDEKEDELYLAIGRGGNKINVYTSVGQYKRTLSLPSGTILSELFLFDDESLLLYDSHKLQDASNQQYDEMTNEFVTYTVNKDVYEKNFVRISRKDGGLLSYLNVPENDAVKLVTGTHFQGQWVSQILRTTRLLKKEQGYLVYNPETDTIYHCDKSLQLTAVMTQTPPVSSQEPMISMNIFFDVGNYQFIEVFTVKMVIGTPRCPSIMLVRDKNAGSLYTAKVIMNDYQGKEVDISPRIMNLSDEPQVGLIEFSLMELQKALAAGKLSGKLKELVASLDEEDSDVYALLRFKSDTELQK